MNDGQDSSFLNKPEEYLAISNTEQLLDEFGDMFEEVKLYQQSVYVEKNLYEKNNLIEERFIAFPRSLATVSSVTTNIWEIDTNEQGFLEKVQKAVIALKLMEEDESNEEMSYERDIVVKGESIKVIYQPYTPDTSEYITRELKDRKELLQKRD